MVTEGWTSSRAMVEATSADARLSTACMSVGCVHVLKLQSVGCPPLLRCNCVASFALIWRSQPA
eukprot:8921978-Heterocapsa_arctica.AAC.1